MFWRLEEARLRQYRGASSAANALSVSAPAVPEGKVWVVIGVGYTPSVAETQVVSFARIWPGVGSLSLLNPVSMNLNPAFATPIEQGMEFYLFPGEYLQAQRVAATAGSTMALYLEFIEIDLPLYTYEDPQEVKRQARVRSSLLSRLGGVTGGGSVRPPTLTGGDRGGRGGPLEK